MNFVVAPIHRLRKKYLIEKFGHKTADPKDVEERFLTLDKYYELARRIIGKFAPHESKASMLSSEDAIDYVAHQIMRGDWGWNVEKKADIKTFRGVNGRKAITAYIRAVMKQNHQKSLDFLACDENSIHDVTTDPKAIEPQEAHIRQEECDERRAYLQVLLESLSEVQRLCIIMHYLDDVSQADIADRLKMSREGVRKSIAEGMKKLYALAMELENEDE